MVKTRKSVEQKPSVLKAKSASTVDGTLQEGQSVVSCDSLRTLLRSSLGRQQLPSLKPRRKLGRRCRKRGVTLESTILSRLSHKILKNEAKGINFKQRNGNKCKEPKKKCVIIDLTQENDQKSRMNDHQFRDKSDTIEEDTLSKVIQRQGLRNKMQQPVNSLPTNSMAKSGENDVSSLLGLNALSDSFVLHSSSDELESCATPHFVASVGDTSVHAAPKELLEVEPMYLCRHYGERTVILMKPQCKVSLRGRAIVKCVVGKVSVLGYDMVPNGQEYSVYCPNSSSYLALESHRSQDVVCSSNLSDLCELESELKSFLNDYPTVVVMRPLCCPITNFITGQAKFHGLFQDLIVLGGISSTDTVKISDTVVTAANGWLSDSKNGINTALAVCGGLNTGKSTTCRFIVNYALNIVSQVAYLECDLGQTEFTLPGCVSLTLIDKPLLGTPFTHQKTPVSSVFVGRLSPASCSGFYVQCLKHIYAAYLSLPSRPPLIVNTMGWMKDVGLALLVDTLRITRPAYVIQLSNDRLQHMRHLPKMTPDFLASSRGVVFKQADDSPMTYKWIEVPSEVNSRSKGDNTYNAPCRRELAILAYFGQLRDNSSFSRMSLRAVTPYQVRWTDVAIHVCHEMVPNSHVLYAVNGSIVALCFADQSQIVNSGVPDCPKFLRKDSVCECLGFGIVRSISDTERALYIITPLSQSALQKVNCLQLGAVSLPSYLMITEEPAACSIPYVDHVQKIPMTSHKKSKEHHQMKKSAATPGENIADQSFTDVLDVSLCS